MSYTSVRSNGIGRRYRVPNYNISNRSINNMENTTSASSNSSNSASELLSGTQTQQKQNTPSETNKSTVSGTTAIPKGKTIPKSMAVPGRLTTPPNKNQTTNQKSDTAAPAAMPKAILQASPVPGIAPNTAPKPAASNTTRTAPVPQSGLPQTNMPRTPQSGTPQMNMPRTPQSGTPQMNMPRTPQSGTPQMNIPQNPQSGTPQMNMPYYINPAYQGMYVPDSNSYQTPMGIPLLPLYGYDSSTDLDQDATYMKGLYPKTAKLLQKEIDEECDKMEYDGSMMFDEYPDKEYLGKIVDRIYGRVNKPEEPSMVETKSLYLYPEKNSSNYLHDMVMILLLTEMCNRRRRYRSRKRWF